MTEVTEVNSRFTITKPRKGNNETADISISNVFLDTESTLGNANQCKVAVNEKEACTESPVVGNHRILALYEDDYISSKRGFYDFVQNVSSYTVTIPKPASISDDNEKNDTQDTQHQEEVPMLGAFSGVYLPCIQNILGVILFIRLPWIVGTAGVIQGFMIVFTCCCCTMLTAISMSAIATNGVVPAGGSYFMISRCLGPEFGGAVGVLFYLGTSFAASMYILGAVEIFLTYMAPSMSMFGDVHSIAGTISMAMLNNMRVYGTILLVILGSIVFIGVKYVNKCAFIFLACVLLSILAIFIGFFTVHERSVPSVCYVGEHLVERASYEVCNRTDQKLQQTYLNSFERDIFNDSVVVSVVSIPGINSIEIEDNSKSHYKKVGEVKEGVIGIKGEIVSDITTSFTILLAIFFPSVTGIMAGSNRSGNLRDAQYSIPRGTIGAILTTSIIYLSSVILYGITVHGDVLRDKYGDSFGGSLLASRVAWPNEWIILIGSLLSTIGAGLQSITGAPRLLQAIAIDGVIPFLRYFSAVSSDGEPKRALLLTLLIAELGIVIASLDSVAPIITMFFLMCYGFVNFACTLQSLLKLPNWRPRFQFYHWTLSLLGMCICLGLMFISSWYYALIAMCVAGFLYKYIEYRGAEKEWGDGFSGLSLSAARFGLLRLEGSRIHTKNWRPQLLVLCDSPIDGVTLNDKTKKLISIASQLKTGRGLTIISSIIEGDILKKALEVDEHQEDLLACMKNEKVKGFCSVVATPNVVDGLSHLIQASGLGALKPNTIVLCWPSNWKDDPNWQAFIHSVRVVAEMKRALVVVKNAEKFPDLSMKEKGSIDIWWIVQDGGMMLLMMFLLKQHKVWRRCQLRLFTVAQISDNSIQIKKELVELMYKLRLSAEVFVIELEDSDISAYTYERTLQAEQRREMVTRMKLSRKESRNEVQMIVDNGHRSRSSSVADGILNTSAMSSPGESVLSNNENASDSTSLNETSSRKPDYENVRRMDTAVKINRLIRERSKDSNLVMINLPKPPRRVDKELMYMEFIEVLTEDLDRMFLVRGGGHEVVTIYS